ncbi:MAG TPA: glycoside hydrolase family 43 protein [Pyrinomonadaceae bacterium]|jgi:GH43 family beta-xylosidase
MPADSKTFTPETYLNPVYPRSFPDPYVIKFRGEYYAYCTDFWRDGRVFGVLRSRDLVNWTEIGGAMQKLDNDAPFYWAPEVSYANGKFYLYYSVGNETLMELRVAVSDRPDGGFVDSGAKLSTEDFAIDGHVFIDTDGQKYFFYATDFLEHTHIGTGTVVDKMTDFFKLEGNPRPVTRARFDWQVYDPHRVEKGGVRWHTVEGPFILKRKNLYYEMFSGGNWQNITYGVSFAVTDDIARNEEWAQFSDGEKVLPILRTIPETVVGPGHNSVVRGVNNRELYCVYHRWTENGRVLAIDRMDFAGARIFINGASHTPQIAPYKPTFADFFDGETVGPEWQAVGDWKAADNEIVCDSLDESRLVCGSKTESFLCEFYLRGAEANGEAAGFGFGLLESGAENFKFLVLPGSNRAAVYYAENGAIRAEEFDLPDDFEASAYHLLRVEIDGRIVKIQLDEANFRYEKTLESAAQQIALAAEKIRAAFSGFALTAGFEDSFDRQNYEPAARGWQKLSGTGDSRAESGELFISGGEESDTILTKGAGAENFEFVCNIRLVDGEESFGFLLLSEKNEEICRFSFEGAAENHYISIDGDLQKFSLPVSFVPENYHQFSFLKTGEKISLRLEDLELGALSLTGESVKIALFCRNSTVAIETARLTVL